MPRIGLVLGAGGAVGHAFHAGVLAALSDTTGWDARDAEVIVGTSAGSIIGALLRAGASPADLAARSTGAALSSQGRQLFDRAGDGHGPLPPKPARARGARRLPGMAAPGAFVRGALQPWSVRFGALAAAALPEGRVSPDFVAARLQPLFDGWPEQSLWINAVALDTSRRVTFGRDDRMHVDVATAVAASCAIPGFFVPVTIGDVRYVDGGVHSPSNADLVAGLDLDLVLVSSPMSVARQGLRLAPDQPARRLARFALAREVAAVRRAGTPVLTFQPTATDLTVIGPNAMDDSRRGEITHRVRESAASRLDRPEAKGRVALLGRASTRDA